MADAAYQQADSGNIDELFGDDDIFGGEGFDEQGDPPMNDSFQEATAQDGPGDAGGDNQELAELLKEGGGELDLNALLNREDGLDTLWAEKGEKADDAQDFSDIDDDDDLPDEEMPDGGPVRPPEPAETLPGINDSAMDTGHFLEDELFGPSSPTEHITDDKPFSLATQQTAAGDLDFDLASDHEEDLEDAADADEQLDEQEQAEWRIQQALFAASGTGLAPATMEENNDEWLKLEFPAYKRDEIPFWTKLVPPRPQRFPYKTPGKPPKPIRPSKLSLEIEPDQKTLFLSLAVANTEPRHDLVKAEVTKTAKEEDGLEDDSDAEDSLPGGVSMQDLEFVCADFDTLSHGDFSDSGVEVTPEPRNVDDDDLFMADFTDFERPVKKRRLGLDAHEIVMIHQYDMPSFDDPENLTARISAQVVLDLNDPSLLVEEVDPEVAKVRAQPGQKSVRAQTVKDRLKQRFKTSNDAEYDLLKQNHQHKVRGQLGHMSIDHSVPAIQLQYPYYKVKLSLGELRNYHRKRMDFKHPFTFNRPEKVKRKERKGRPIKEIYLSTRDLSLRDNSNAMLLEYSEEHPTMLSQIGMGNKIVNYYRRKAADDTARPKLDIGETNVLLPEDKSPFHMFGHIGPGETVTALYNSMYRAPLFEHPNKDGDFLVVRERTGIRGVQHFIRNVDHLYVVGQELPSVTVPGTHSRMVTTASKNRLKAISYRIARKKKSNRIRVEEVTRHFPDTSDMQNRQKMKEFMAFSKEHKEWEMRSGEAIPDEDTIQGMIRPEDICLLESMQVGHQYLQDAGYADRDDGDDDDGKENENDSIEQQLAPWKTTKNFLQATQGKAMLKLYGEGDPSGRGEAFSFIKTSMKGGFKAQGGSVQDAINMASNQGLGGHKYNVAAQQKSYEDSVRAIWEKQKASLSSHIEPDDIDDEGVDGQIDDYSRGREGRAPSVAGTPSVARRRDDDTATSFSKRSIGSQSQSTLQITRQVRRGGEIVTEVEYINDPAVVKQYRKIKEAEEVRNIKLSEIKPTGDAEIDARGQRRLQEEIERLKKASARRQQREKTKAALNAASPGVGSPDGDNSTPSGKQVQATQRKCANCGQVGHIKTNKKSVGPSSLCNHCGLPLWRKLMNEFMNPLARMMSNQ